MQLLCTLTTGQSFYFSQQHFLYSTFLHVSGSWYSGIMLTVHHTGKFFHIIFMYSFVHPSGLICIPSQTLGQGTRKVTQSRACVAPSEHRMSTGARQAKPQQCSSVLRADPSPLGLFHLLLKTHQRLPAPAAEAGERETVRHGGLSPSSGLSHSAVSLNTPTYACTHKLKLHLNSLNSLRGNLQTMEHDLSYCLLA